MTMTASQTEFLLSTLQAKRQNLQKVREEVLFRILNEYKPPPAAGTDTISPAKTKIQDAIKEQERIFDAAFHELDNLFQTISANR